MEGNAASLERQMEKTIASLTEKLGKLENRVAGSVESVTDSVMSVHDALNIKYQIRRRPWTMMVGAAALGYIGAARQARQSGPARERLHSGRDSAQTAASASKRQSPPANGNKDRDEKKKHSAPAGPNWLASLGAAFEPELAELKGIAIGTILGVVHEMLAKKDDTDSAPSPAQPKRNESGVEAQQELGMAGAPHS